MNASPCHSPGMKNTKIPSRSACDVLRLVCNRTQLLRWRHGSACLKFFLCFLLSELPVERVLNTFYAAIDSAGLKLSRAFALFPLRDAQSLLCRAVDLAGYRQVID